MSHEQAWRVGDRIQNAYGCIGRVTAISKGTMTARFSLKGEWTETYTPDWFKAYGHLLRKMGGGGASV